MTPHQLRAFQLDFAREVYGCSEWLSQHPTEADDDIGAMAIAYGADNLKITIEIPMPIPPAAIRPGHLKLEED